MHLYEKSTLVFGEDAELVLHLSEPNFTFWQRFTRRILLLWSHFKEMF